MQAHLFTNSLYTPWDAQFYPEGNPGLDGELDAKPEAAWRSIKVLRRISAKLRGHQVRLEGGRRFLRLLLLRMSEGS